MDANAQLVAVGAVGNNPGVNVISTHTAGSDVQNRVKYRQLCKEGGGS